MGKYIRKGKMTGEVAVVEPSLVGVRTRARAKTLALHQRLQKSPPPPLPCSSSSSSSSSKSSSCYLQLRSRRLEKCFLTKTQKAANPRTNPSSSPVSSPKENKRNKEEAKSENNAGIEPSLGENVLDAEGKGSRNSRETTPCSLIRRDSETIRTPGSTNRPTSTIASNMRILCSTRRNVPTSREMEEFFAVPEQRQQRAFAEKYNFDPAKDCPLPGRYEWIKLDS